jgi:hypothetical protein
LPRLSRPQDAGTPLLPRSRLHKIKLITGLTWIRTRSACSTVRALAFSAREDPLHLKCGFPPLPVHKFHARSPLRFGIHNFRAENHLKQICSYIQLVCYSDIVPCQSDKAHQVSFTVRHHCTVFIQSPNQTRQKLGASCRFIFIFVCRQRTREPIETSTKGSKWFLL